MNTADSLRRAQGPLLVVTAAVVWSTSGLGIKLIPLFPLAIAGWRSLFALPMLSLFGAVRGIRIELLRRPLFIATVLSYCLTVCLFVTATRLTTAANAILLQYTCPLWVILLSFVFSHEKPARRDYLACAGCMAGLALFFVDKLTMQGFWGNVAGLLAGLAMASLFVSLRMQRHDTAYASSVSAVFFGNIACAVFCLPWMLAAVPQISPGSWAILAALGSFQLALGYAAFTAGIRRVPALRATLLGFIEPVLNPLWVALGSGEVPGTGAVLGGALILGSFAADSILRQRTRARQKLQEYRGPADTADEPAGPAGNAIG